MGGKEGFGQGAENYELAEGVVHQDGTLGGLESLEDDKRAITTWYQSYFPKNYRFA